MNKSDLVKYVSNKTMITEVDAKVIVDVLFDAMKKALEEEIRITIKNFGSLSVQDRKARLAVNPRTREEIKIPPKKVIKFTVSKKFSDLINKNV
jgi:nucleoid DNA-binding protein